MGHHTLWDYQPLTISCLYSESGPNNYCSLSLVPIFQILQVSVVVFEPYNALLMGILWVIQLIQFFYLEWIHWYKLWLYSQVHSCHLWCYQRRLLVHQQSIREKNHNFPDYQIVLFQAIHDPSHYQYDDNYTSIQCTMKDFHKMMILKKKMKSGIS